MSFREQQVKGLERYLIDEDLPPDRLRVHISEVGPGGRSHPPHTHDGVEAIYMLEGEATLEIGGESQPVSASEATVFDPTKLHSLVNTGTMPMRYMVIITRP